MRFAPGIHRTCMLMVTFNLWSIPWRSKLQSTLFCVVNDKCISFSHIGPQSVNQCCPIVILRALRSVPVFKLFMISRWLLLLFQVRITSSSSLHSLLLYTAIFSRVNTFCLTTFTRFSSWQSFLPLNYIYQVFMP